ncbi:MAG: tRNA 2-selenouridine(34) synthase MnmH [Sulfurimonadaceae bacterium]|nr:tRNA 2-selenouridine(34) synthase MnmH [Sulfurimonadaceae bacterium]
MSLLYDDFKSIVLNKTPLLDVRAPVEFKKGAFLNAVNLPIMNDEERHLVGICYKNQGNKKAIELGHTLVSADIREERIVSWINFIDANPSALLYCFRGGQRSKIAQEWLHERGREIVRLKGGYKAFRAYLINELKESTNHFKPIILGGRTGSGKTIVLKKMQNSIDLESLANHRGSSFGSKINLQPMQIDFENNLAYELIQKIEDGFKTLVFEDEGKHIGSSFMPDNLITTTLNAPLVILEAQMHERVDITLDEYVIQAQEAYIKAGFESALEEWSKNIQDAMSRITRRLGLEKYKKVSGIFENALDEQKRNGSYDGYREWAKFLLEEYYDPMYDYQIQKRSHMVSFRGNAEEVQNYIKKLSAN